MRILLLFILTHISLGAFAQNMICYQDIRDRFFIFDSGLIFEESAQSVQDYGITNNAIVYFNNQKDLMVYRNRQTTKVTFNANRFYTTDYLIGYQGGTGLKVIDNGKIHELTLNIGYYSITDSLALFEDRLYNTFNLYYRGKIQEMSRGVYDNPAAEVTAGENIFVFKNLQARKYQVFWNNKTQDVLNTNDRLKFACGRNIMAYNDPVSQTFVIYYKGEFFDAEELHASSYKAGDDLIAYQDVQGNLKVFDPMKKFDLQTVSSYQPDFYEVRDRIVVFTENKNIFKVYDGNKVHTLESNFVPPSYKMDNKMIVWVDQMGGLKGLIDGEVKQIISEKIKDYAIHGNVIKIQLNNGNYSVYWKGKIY